MLFAPYYIAIRPFTDPLLAYTFALFLVMVVGAGCLYLVFRRLTLGPLEALLVSAFFWSSPNVIVGFTGVWAQSASVFVIPPILLLAMIAADMRDGRPRLVLAWLAGILAALLLIQDFYTAQFALLIVALLIVGVLLLERAQLHGVVRAVSAWLSTHRRFVSALAIFGVVGSLLFLWIYVPAYLEQPGFPPDHLWNALWQINPPSWHSRTDVFVNLRRYDGIRSFVLVLVLTALVWVPAFRVPRAIRLDALWVIVVTAIVLVVPFK